MSVNLPTACALTAAHLVDLVYGEASDVPAEARAHLASCERCQGEKRALAETRAVVGALPLQEPSSELDYRILAALDAHLAGEDLAPHLRLSELAFEDAPPPAKSLPPSLMSPEALERAAASAPRPRSSRRWTAAVSAAAGFAFVALGVFVLTDQPAQMALHVSPPAAAPAAERKQLKAFGQDRIDERADVPPPPEVVTAVPVDAPREEAERQAVAGKLAAAQAPGPALAATRGDADHARAPGTVNGRLNDAARPEPMPEFDGAKAPVDTREREHALEPSPQAGPKGAAAPALAAPVGTFDQKQAVEEKAVAADGDLDALGGGDDKLGSSNWGGGGNVAPSQPVVTGRSPAPPPALFARSSISSDSAPSRASPAKDLAKSDALQLERETGAERSKKKESAFNELRRPAATLDASGAASVSPAPAAPLQVARWQLLLDEARNASARGQHVRAAQLYAQAAAERDLPADRLEAALEGRVDALASAGQYDAAEQAATELASRFPSRSAARERVRRARLQALDAEEKVAAPASVPAGR